MPTCAGRDCRRPASTRPICAAPATDPTLWTTATLRGAKIDVDQALAYAAAHGLDIGS